ncbi:MAG: 1-(5-phosphoribosyl)-5-[(5-phosphoribosylamino)methylideneamino] imidazole-4-carboxamide isomerase [Dehalococcoidia bacterium]
MEIIPAIDIRGGRCVRLDQGDYARETVFDDDPVAVARRWQAAGATRLHVVDLDGARDGIPRNADVIHRLIAAVAAPNVAAAAAAGAEGESSDLPGGGVDRGVSPNVAAAAAAGAEGESSDLPRGGGRGVRVQVGGGVRHLETIDTYLKAGAGRVALGTTAVKDQTILVNAVALFRERIFVGVDARDGMVATEGWRETSQVRALDLVQQLSEFGVPRIFYTDISRDGMLGGPNFPAIQEVVEHASGLPSPMAVIASGGVSSIEHLQRLRLIGVEGVIIGKALYTGALDLREALAAVS